jgi:ElaB/YqjD/DUF883 family membrane-anchored ribosome-binding protein
MEAASDKVINELREAMAAAEKLLAESEIEERVRKHPLAAIAVAAGVGLLIGLLLSRK